MKDGMSTPEREPTSLTRTSDSLDNTRSTVVGGRGQRAFENRPTDRRGGLSTEGALRGALDTAPKGLQRLALSLIKFYMDGLNNLRQGWTERQALESWDYIF